MKQHTRRIPAKGTSRRVVIVPGLEDSMFEQIIYIVRDDRASQSGVSAEHILREAEDMLKSESDELPQEERSPFFSGVVLGLLTLALILLTAILLYLHFYGLP